MSFCSLVIAELEQVAPQRDVNSRDSDSDVATTAEDATNKTLDVTARAEDDNSDEWSDVTTSDDDDDRCVVA